MIGNALKIIQWLYAQEKDKLFEIKFYKKKRNNNQNSKYWKLIHELSLVTKIGVEELHFDMLKNYSPRYQIMVPLSNSLRGIEYYELKEKKINKKGELFGVYYVYTPSHELNTSEFAILLNGLIQECKQQGIDTRSYDEIIKDNMYVGWR